MYYKYLLFLTLVFYTQLASSESSIQTVSDITYSHLAPKSFLLDSIYNNPSLRHFRDTLSLSQINLGGLVNMNTQRPLLQTGTDRYSWGINLESYHVWDEDTKLWGAASFRSYEKASLAWNSNIDLDKIYPYVIADTIGGGLKGEVYNFEGGFSRALGKYILGAQLSVGATIAYRQLDPRPLNKAIDLNATLSIGRVFAKRHILALAVNAERYSQNSSVQFMNELGQAKVYHLSGMGMHYVRFAGANNTAYYYGLGSEFSLDYSQTDALGLYAHTKYRMSSLEKTLPDRNDIAINGLKDRDVSVLLGYNLQTDRLDLLGVSLNYERDKRRGEERIFGDAVGSVYPQIATSEMYGRSRETISLNIVVNNEMANWRSTTTLRPEIVKEKEHYLTPERQREYEIMHISLGQGFLFRLNKGLLHSNTLLTKTVTLDREQVFTSHSKDVAFGLEIENDIFNYNSSNSFGLSQSLRYDLPLRSQKQALSFGSQFEMLNKQGYKTFFNVFASIGVIF